MNQLKAGAALFAVFYVLLFWFASMDVYERNSVFISSLGGEPVF